MTARTVSFLLVATLGACDAARTASDAPLAGGCDGGTGLHLAIDLSAPRCHAISPGGPNWSIEVGAGSTVLDKFNAVWVHPSYDPNRIELLWRWPAGTADGLEAQITWSGNGEGLTTGVASQPYRVARNQCVEVVVTPTCTTGIDAGVPDAPP